MWLVLKATRQHARNLAFFAVVYKSTMLLLRYRGPNGWGKEGPYDAFVAGLLGGYFVFARSPGPVSQQVSNRPRGLFPAVSVFADVESLDCDIRVRARGVSRRKTRSRTESTPSVVADNTWCAETPNRQLVDALF